MPPKFRHVPPFFKTRIFAFALRLVLRDWRSGELTILAASLIIAVAGTSTVSLLGHRLTRTVEAQAAEFLAADLVVTGHETIPADFWNQAEQQGLAHAATVEFSSVLVENDALQLCGVKAVDDVYPLRGSLIVSASDAGHGVTVYHGPPRGEAWVDHRVLTQLGLKLGDSVTVGELKLTINRMLINVPDSRGDLFGLAPQVMINLEDLPGTKVIQPGSHAHYYALFAGPPGAILQLKASLKSRLTVRQRIVDIHEDRPEMGKALSRAERYLGLTSIAIVIIAGVAIAMSARRYTARHYDLTAMLKCLGAAQRDVLAQHLIQYLVVGLAASLIGTGIGYAAQLVVVGALSSLLPKALLAPSWTALMFGPLIGISVLLGFALPTILRIRHLPPLRVLRRDLAPMAASGWFVYGLAGLTVAILAWTYTGDARLTLWVIAISLAILVAAGLVVYAFVCSLRQWLPRLNLTWRFGIQNLTRLPHLSTGQILAFGLTLSAMFLVLLVRTELIGEWRRQLPADVPNYFAMNLLPADLERFSQYLAEHSIQASRFYPIVRGRLTQLNGTDIKQNARKDSEGEAAINRDLSLTYADVVPEDNRVVEGNWWDSSYPDAQVSVEERLAKNLGIRLGDRLTFSVADRSVEATVSSIRSLRWDTMKPNFYVIFKPGVLETLPRTYLGSFHLAEGRQRLLADVAKAFPALTVLQIDALLKQLQLIVQEVTIAVEFVLAFALAAGFAVLAATARASLDSRIYEHALLRVMGAKGDLLRNALAIEFGGLGLLAGLFAAALTDSLVWVLFWIVFDMEPRLHWQLWLAGPVLGGAVVGASGYWFTRQAINNSPAVVLRES